MVEVGQQTGAAEDRRRRRYARSDGRCCLPAEFVTMMRRGFMDSFLDSEEACHTGRFV
jgi:hypothetical protein